MSNHTTITSLTLMSHRITSTSSPSSSTRAITLLYSGEQNHNQAYPEKSHSTHFTRRKKSDTHHACIPDSTKLDKAKSHPLWAAYRVPHLPCHQVCTHTKIRRRSEISRPMQNPPRIKEAAKALRYNDGQHAPLLLHPICHPKSLSLPQWKNRIQACIRIS